MYNVMHNNNNNFFKAAKEANTSTSANRLSSSSRISRLKVNEVKRSTLNYTIGIFTIVVSMIIPVISLVGLIQSDYYII